MLLVVGEFGFGQCRPGTVRGRPVNSRAGVRPALRVVRRCASGRRAAAIAAGSLRLAAGAANGSSTPSMRTATPRRERVAATGSRASACRVRRCRPACHQVPQAKRAAAQPRRCRRRSRRNPARRRPAACAACRPTSAPSASNRLPLRDASSPPPAHGSTPSVFNTGSQCACESTVPKPPGDAPASATGARRTPRDVVRGARQPVDRVLEHAGDAVVVFRRDQQDAVAGDQARLQGRPPPGQASRARSASYSGMPCRVATSTDVVTGQCARGAAGARCCRSRRAGCRKCRAGGPWASPMARRVAGPMWGRIDHAAELCRR